MIGTVYKPKHDDGKTLQDLSASLRKIQSDSPSSDIIIGGDFNQPNVNWTINDIIPGHWASSSTAQALLNIIAEFGLEQLVREPTREKSILDLMLTNNPSVFSSVSVEPGISDHSIVVSDLSLMPRYRKKTKRKIFIRRKADLDGIKNHLRSFSESYFNELSSESIQTKWDSIQHAVTEAMENMFQRRVLQIEGIYLGSIGHTGGFVGRNNAYTSRPKSLARTKTGRLSRASEGM